MSATLVITHRRMQSSPDGTHQHVGVGPAFRRPHSQPSGSTDLDAAGLPVRDSLPAGSQRAGYVRSMSALRLHVPPYPTATCTRTHNLDMLPPF